MRAARTGNAGGGGTECGFLKQILKTDGGGAGGNGAPEAMADLHGTPRASLEDSEEFSSRHLPEP